MFEITDRQVRRLLRRYEQEGAAGLVSRRRGQPSNRCIAEAVKAAVMERVKERLPTLAPHTGGGHLFQGLNRDEIGHLLWT